MKRLLLILAVVAAQLFAGPSARVAPSAELSGAPTIARASKDATGLQAQLASARRNAVQVARSRTRTREQRTRSMVSVATNPTARFASIVAHRPNTNGTINPERFLPLGLPDTRAP
ncbi:MAG: hypothetical protein ABIT20_10420 [Gemmatimonadaceae bacterium]